jgi:hypothetical protein
VFWVISVYFYIRNILPKSGTFPLGYLYICIHTHTHTQSEMLATKCPVIVIIIAIKRSVLALRNYTLAWRDDFFCILPIPRSFPLGAPDDRGATVH